MTRLTRYALVAGAVAFVAWLLRPAPMCQGTYTFGQGTYPCRYFAGHAGTCEPDWMWQ